MMTNHLPHFQHDCLRCIFIGFDEETRADWYIHAAQGDQPQEYYTSVLGRYGNGGSEYWSMSIDVLKQADPKQGTPFLTRAIQIAKDEGCIRA